MATPPVSLTVPRALVPWRHSPALLEAKDACSFSWGTHPKRLPTIPSSSEEFSGPKALGLGPTLSSPMGQSSF